MDDDPVAVYLRELCRVPPVNSEEESILRTQIQSTDPCEVEKAKVRLLESHLGAVVSIAQRRSDSGVHILERIQAGNNALLAAVNTFAASGHASFLAHARPYIEAALEREEGIVGSQG